jgi:hypothetical protein
MKMDKHRIRSRCLHSPDKLLPLTCRTQGNINEDKRELLHRNQHTCAFRFFPAARHMNQEFTFFKEFLHSHR